ncbi:ABC transporter ATP-binding protein [Bacillus dakarensis]|uniref:ABC transporter ATP-binding protein n=1 Tax=Robertmurraya dakarensis TaxID=1926278 RepID=UPI000981DA78|nr:ABC transporter ATP-binding protein [Bacillus dakarensis]
MTLLNISNLSKSFGNETILAHLNLSVAEGEFVSILGPSGSGKSTLFHLVGGILAPDEGEINLNGDVISGKRGYISYMPQTPSLLPWRNILHNVTLGQELQRKADKETAKDMLMKAGLQQYMNAYPNELSGGMKQRAAFIRALLSPQSVLCLDEPFSALDELTRQEMQEWLLGTWEEYKKTILFVTHNIEEALFLSDRIIILSSKPAQVKAEVTVPFSRPREKKLLLEDEFFKWKRKVYNLLTSTADEYITRT